MTQPIHDFPYPIPRRSRKRLLLAEAQNWRCAYCAIVVDADDVYTDNALTIDEVVPVARNGPPSWDNQVMACRLCNNGKGHYDAEVYHGLVVVHGRHRAPKLIRQRDRLAKKAARAEAARRRAAAVVVELSGSAAAVPDEVMLAFRTIYAPQFGIRGKPPQHQP